MQNFSVSKNFTLPFAGSRAVVFLFVFILSAVALPQIAHLAALPVRYILPMHWPVLLAGLVYGWRAGLIVGAMSPVASFMFSGMPPVAFLPVMVPELAVYGLLSGLFREVFKLGSHLALVLALIAGRLAFSAAFVLSGIAAEGTMSALSASLLPGLPAAMLQLILLPPLASWWIESETNQN
ncbi:MAG: ECF transporter S component [Bacteroidetes bacterium]|nr:ECF transporter S component [Bacteroidota bacterium]